ncbi:MAG: cytochrome c3 family protein [Candidatus Polarisedimenticolaceae bacterium]|nr:cytochrome c3 family protein [Candidatus Polarisedimenticolaceae bacterium]
MGSKHDLGITNYYGPMGGSSTEVCVFCHTPHGANIEEGPLWNRKITNTTLFQMYTSPTMDTTCAATPNSLSLACLSCHDTAFGGGGSGAVDSIDTHNIINDSNSDGGESTPNCNACHPGGGVFPGEWWQIGPDLSNDHPISIIYADALADDPGFNPPPDPEKGWSDIKLFNGRVECPSCHNPHDPTNVPFLRAPIAGSALCLTCHNK